MSWGSYAWGAAAYGGAALLSGSTTDPERPPVLHGLDVRVYVANIERTSLILNDSLRLTDELGSRTTCTFEIADTTKELRVEVGAVVRVTLDDYPIFGGTVDEVREETAGGWSDVNLIECTCVDWTQLCDRHIVAARFETEGQTLKDVVEDIVNEQSGDFGERLSDEGMTTDGVQEGPVLSTVSFNYKTVARCFDAISELIGYTWHVDPNKELKFYERSTYYAPYELDDAKWQQYRKLRFKRSREKYRNIQYLLAGTAKTNLRTESFKGDGETRTFTLAMPCAEEPTLKVDGSTVSADIVDVRINDQDQPEIEWFWKLGEKEISQNSDTELYTALTASQVLEVTYRGHYPISAVARDDTEIAKRKTAESDSGTSAGVYVDVEDDDNIDDLDMALERAMGMLRRYARIETIVEFETDQPGFRRGQLLKVNQPDFGISSDFLITKVSFSYVDDSFFRYKISAVEGEDMGGWADFWKRLVDKGRPFVIGKDDRINVVRAKVSGIIVGDRLSTTDPLQDWTVDPASYLIIGTSKIGGRKRISAESADDVGVVYGPMIGWPHKGPATVYAGIAEVTTYTHSCNPPGVGDIAYVSADALDASAAIVEVSIPLGFAGFEGGTSWECYNDMLRDNAQLVSTPTRTGNWALNCYPSGTTDGSAEFGAWDAAGNSDYWNCATLYTKFMFRIEEMPASNEQVCGWWDQNGYIKARLHINGAGKLMLYNRQGTDTLLDTGDTVLDTGLWYRIECKIGTGIDSQYEVKINGVSEFNGTSDFSTSNHAEAWLGRTSYGFTSADGSADFYYDDVSFDSGTWIGNTYVKAMEPDGDSATHTGWTASTGNKWECVDDSTINNDTDYISSTTSGATYTATLESTTSAGISGTIRQVAACSWCKKTGSSATGCKTRVRSGTTDSDMSDVMTLSSTEYYSIPRLLVTDPATSSAWTTSALNSTEVGVLKEANTYGVRCTKVLLSVEYQP